MLGFMPDKDVVKIEKLLGKSFGNGLTMNPDERTVYTLEYTSKDFWKFVPFSVSMCDSSSLIGLKAYFPHNHGINFTLALSLSIEKSVSPCGKELIDIEHQLVFSGARGRINTTVEDYIELIENASGKLVVPQAIDVLQKEYGTGFIEKITNDSVLKKINKIITKNVTY